MKNKAFEFEALICETQALSLRVEGMKAENKRCELLGTPPSYGEGYFISAAEDMKAFAIKFRKMGGVE